VTATPFEVVRSLPRPIDALDRVERLDAQGVTAVKAITGNEPFFSGHYPGHPVYPGVFVLEAVHQAALYFARQQLGRAVRLAEVRSIRFLATLGPGDTLRSDCTCVVAAGGDMLTVEAGCSRDERVCAHVKLIYRIEAKATC
jgi:3-hydroxyacyl-[acyl-carrier-protein] dehydratase